LAIVTLNARTVRCTRTPYYACSGCSVMFLDPEQFNAFGEAASVRERILGTRPKRVIRPARLRFASVHALVVCPVAFGNYLACSSLIFLARASCPKGQLERRGREGSRRVRGSRRCESSEKPSANCYAPGALFVFRLRRLECRGGGVSRRGLTLFMRRRTPW